MSYKTKFKTPLLGYKIQCDYSAMEMSLRCVKIFIYDNLC